jgi:hypothetical protein
VYWFNAIPIRFQADVIVGIDKMFLQ